MSIKIAVATIVVLMSANVAFACSKQHQQTQSCGVGTVWDAESMTCTKQVSS
ncbi:hypothetical protein [Parasedimentitalea marina]|uniref:hypothetical protein n=1 Tax=Parasedimentitalea marina TaxID=2483033 RepID=UPI0013E3AE06|nr:hypothetical protein [Parasedimentitalea marina]